MSGANFMTDGTDNRYSVFGGVLRTTLNLPELHHAPAFHEVTWTLSVHHDVPAPTAEFSWAAFEELAGGVSVKLERSEDGRSRLTYSDTGTFDISANGKRIAWYRSHEAHEVLARTDILGRVLSLAARADGIMMLHASAVAMDGVVAGFLAPKFVGKSTIACALTDGGAHLVTDDALAVRAGDRVECAPGVPAIKLRPEAAAHLRGARSTATGDWRHFERRDVEEIITDWSPLGALYVLVPMPANATEQPVTRERLVGAEAAIALVRFAKLGGLLGGVLAVDYLEKATEIASRIPVYTLRCVRDLARLHEVSEKISRWHRE